MCNKEVVRQVSLHSCEAAADGARHIDSFVCREFCRYVLVTGFSVFFCAGGTSEMLLA